VLVYRAQLWMVQSGAREVGRFIADGELRENELILLRLFAA